MTGPLPKRRNSSLFDAINFLDSDRVYDEAEGFLNQGKSIYSDIIHETGKYDLPELDMASKIIMSQANNQRSAFDIEGIRELRKQGYSPESGTIEIIAGEKIDEALEHGSLREGGDESPLYVKISYRPASKRTEAWVEFDKQPQELENDVSNILKKYGFNDV